MSRVVDKRCVFGDEEKEFFKTTMRRLEAFTGVRVLTHCLMSNHFHILVEVPKVDVLDDAALLERLRIFYSGGRLAAVEREFGRARAHLEHTGSGQWLDALRARYFDRMGNLSCFVKELKERFSKWYNRREERRGTLWEERFKSVLVEGSENALLTVAAYIDLNPVRAGIVDDPKDYRHCGYAEAVAGGRHARAGLRVLVGAEKWRSAAARYRSLLFAAGRRTEARAGFDPARVRAVLDAGGELGVGELLRCHARYFNDGVALGGRLFVEEVFARNRAWFGKRRSGGARELEGGGWNGLFCLRNFANPLAVPG